jgi:O-antigen/teichoic acid export membrane protein
MVFHKKATFQTVGRLRWDTLAYGIGLAIDRFSGFLLLPILTGAWDQQNFAAWSQILVAYAFLSNILLVGFYHAIVRYVPGAGRDVVSKVFHGMMAIILGNCALFLLVVSMTPQFVSTALLASSQHEHLVMPAAAFIVSECILEFVLLGFMRADGKIVVCSTYYAVKNLARLALLALLAQQGVATSLISLAVFNVGLTCVVYGVHIAPSLVKSSQCLEPGFWRRVMGYSLPIVVSSNFSWANVSLNRFLIVHFLGIADLAVYAVNYSIASIVHVTSMIINFTLIPRINAAWNIQDMNQVRTLLKMATEYYLFGALPIGLAIGLFYPQLLSLLAPATYNGTPALVMMLVCFMILLGLEQILLFVTLIKNSSFSLGVRSFALVITILLNVMLIKSEGLTGSVLAANAALVTTIVLSVWHLKRVVVGYTFPWREACEIFFAGVVMLAVGFVLVAWLPSSKLPVLIFSGIICGLVFIGAESFRSGSVSRALIAALKRSQKGPESGVMSHKDVPIVHPLTQESSSETLFPRN